MEPDLFLPPCPKECNINPALLDVAVQKIADGEAFLVNNSCEKKVNDSLSFNFQYSTEDEIRRRDQFIDTDLAPPSFMPPMEGFEQTMFGWNLELSQDDKFGEGYCITFPQVIQGPFPYGNLKSCIHELEFACSRIKQNDCPCFNEKDMKAIKMKLMKKMFDPDFQVDFDLSCKSPSENNGFPFGLYTKAHKSYDDLYGSTLRAGVDMDGTMFPDRKLMNKCHYNYLSEKEAQLSISQHEKCVPLIEDLCDFMKDIFPQLQTPAKPLCSDDETFRYKQKAWKSCKNMVENASGRKKKRRCKKFDEESQKYIFQHCRKSCGMCSCTDNIDFTYGGQSEYNCEWINSLNPMEKAEKCSIQEIKENCVASCDGKCCANSRRFSYWKRDQYSMYGWRRNSCGDISNSNWREECKNKNIAWNCPMICRKCIIQPK